MTKPLKKSKITDYMNVVLPKPKVQGNKEKDIPDDHSNFTATERRAEILQIALTQGHFDLPGAKLAKLYHVSNATVSQDKDVIQEYTATKYWKPVKVISEAVAAQQKALRESIKVGKWRDVSQISETIIELCFNLGLVEKQTQKIDAEGLNITFQIKQPPKRKIENNDTIRPPPAPKTVHGESGEIPGSN